MSCEQLDPNTPPNVLHACQPVTVKFHDFFYTSWCNGKDEKPGQQFLSNTILKHWTIHLSEFPSPSPCNASGSALFICIRSAQLNPDGPQGPRGAPGPGWPGPGPGCKVGGPVSTWWLRIACNTQKITIVCNINCVCGKMYIHSCYWLPACESNFTIVDFEWVEPV